MTNLTFTVADLDTYGYTNWTTQHYRYWDHIAITGTTATWTSTRGADLSGAGTLTDPWRQTTFTNSASGNRDAAHQVKVTFTSPVTSFTFRYWTRRGESAYTGTQAVWVGNMTYKANCL